MPPEQKFQVGIATKIIVDEQNNRTCIVVTFPSVHLPSFMSMGQTVLSYRRIRILRTDGWKIGQTDTRTEGKPKVPTGDTPVGD